MTDLSSAIGDVEFHDACCMLAFPRAAGSDGGP
jgi:hypothetical protein